MKRLLSRPAPYGLQFGNVFEQLEERLPYVVDERTGPTGGLGIGENRLFNQ